jgi:tryptophanyl-tRNA synthetase
VWQFHKVYSDADTCAWVRDGCPKAKFGCLSCKQPVIDAVLREQQPMLERAQPYVSNPQRVREIIDLGTQRARQVAQETMTDVRTAIGLNY